MATEPILNHRIVLYPVPFHEMEEIPRFPTWYELLRIDPEDKSVAMVSSSRTSVRGKGAPLRYSPKDVIDRRKSTTECDICHKPFATSKEKQGDHNYQTGEFRGIICSGCNIFIAYLEKMQREPDLTTAAKKYLDENRAFRYS